MPRPRWLIKFLGWLLLVGTVGVASCQALFASSSQWPDVLTSFASGDD